jgi:hypothetical protein
MEGDGFTTNANQHPLHKKTEIQRVCGAAGAGDDPLLFVQEGTGIVQQHIPGKVLAARAPQLSDGIPHNVHVFVAVCHSRRGPQTVLLMDPHEGGADVMGWAEQGGGQLKRRSRSAFRSDRRPRS